MRYAEIAKENHEKTTVICFAIPRLWIGIIFNANPVPTFHFHCRYEFGSGYPNFYTRWKKTILHFILSSASLHCFFFLVSVMIFKIFGLILKFWGKIQLKFRFSWNGSGAAEMRPIQPNLEVLEVLFWGVKAFSVAWTSFKQAYG